MSMKKLYFFVFFSLSVSLLHAQAPVIEWQHSIGGSDNDDAQSIQQTVDGGYIVAGVTNSSDGDVTSNHGGSDAWIVKLAADGSIQWQETLGGSNNDNAGSVAQTSDGGFIVAGTTFSNDGDVTGNHGASDAWIIKLTSTGSVQWKETLGSDGFDYAGSIQPTSDGGYIFSGSTYAGNFSGRNYWVVRLAADGQIIWNDILGGSADDIATTASQTSDGGFIVSGYSSSKDGEVTENHDNPSAPNPADYWIVKLTTSGNIEWEHSFGGSLSERAANVQQTSDGGYIISGYSNSNDGDVTGNPTGVADFWIVKLTPTGTLQWEETLGGSQHDYAQWIQQTADGGYIVTGHSDSGDGDVTSFKGSYNYWVVKLFPGGGIQGQETLGGSNVDEAHQIKQTADGGFIVTGNSYSNDLDVTGHHGSTNTNDGWVVKLQGPQNIVIGLDWLSFNGILAENGVASLSWRTANEENVDGYSIEYATEASGSFKEVGYVKAKNVTDAEYHFSYTNAVNTNNIFRIKSKQANGKITYSSSIDLRANDQSGFSFGVFPNPFHNTGLLQIKTNKQVKVDVVIVDATGHQVLQPAKNMTLSAGIHQINVNTSSLPVGVYWAKLLSDDGTIKAFKIVKE